MVCDTCPTPQENIQDCIDECVDRGGVAANCRRSCTSDPSYPCTPQDNTANHDACEASVDAWLVACVLDPIGWLSDVEDIGCFILHLDCPTCDSIANDSRNACPGTTICI